MGLARRLLGITAEVWPDVLKTIKAIKSGNEQLAQRRAIEAARVQAMRMAAKKLLKKR